MLEALGSRPDLVIDSGKDNYSSTLLVGIFEVNRFVAACVEEILQYFSRAAFKYRQKHKKVPVLIIDNADRLVQDGQEMILDLFQNYAKRASDQGTVTVVFVSSERSVPFRMCAHVGTLYLNFWIRINQLPTLKRLAFAGRRHPH